MASLELRNVIRDNKQVICFLEDQSNNVDKNSMTKSSFSDSHSKASSDSDKTSSSESGNDIASILCIQDPTHQFNEVIGNFCYVDGEDAEKHWESQVGDEKLSNDQYHDVQLKTFFKQSNLEKFGEFF